MKTLVDTSITHHTLIRYVVVTVCRVTAIWVSRHISPPLLPALCLAVSPCLTGAYTNTPGETIRVLSPPNSFTDDYFF